MKKMEELGELQEEAYSPTEVPGVKTIELSAPIAVQYEINFNCNQNCYFCYNVWKGEEGSKADKEPSWEVRKEIVERIISLDIFEVVLSGGEPLLAPEIVEIVSRFSEAGVNTHLITNGRLLDGNMVRELKQAGLGGIQISLHAPDSEINDTITQTPGSFEDTIAGIENAVAIFDTQAISVNMVLVKDNYTEVKRMMRMLNDMGDLHFSVGFLSLSGAAASKDSQIMLEKDKLVETFRTVMSTADKLDMDMGIAGGFPFCLFSEEEQQEIMQMPINICDAGLNQIVVSPTGEIRPCVSLPQELGNILEADPKEIWQNSDFLQSLRNLEHVPSQCYDCDMVSVCKGGCRAAAYYTYGSFDKPDPLVAGGDNR